MKTREFVEAAIYKLADKLRLLKACALKVGLKGGKPTLKVEIRPLSAVDLTAIASSFDEPGAAATVDDLNQQIAGHIGVSVAWIEAVPVAIGFIHWEMPRHEKLIADWPRTPELFRLWTTAKHRSGGIGTQMLAHFERAAALRGYTRIGLGVHLQNRRAYSLYKRLGYQLAGAPFYDCYQIHGCKGHLRKVEVLSLFLVKRLQVDEPMGLCD